MTKFEIFFSMMRFRYFEKALLGFQNIDECFILKRTHFPDQKSCQMIGTVIVVFSKNIYRIFLLPNDLEGCYKISISNKNWIEHAWTCCWIKKLFKISENNLWNWRRIDKYFGILSYRPCQLPITWSRRVILTYEKWYCLFNRSNTQLKSQKMVRSKKSLS